jgi:DNA-binding GntR family transcriptional regulator
MLASVELQDRAYRLIRRKILEGRVHSRKDLARRVLEDELGVSSTCIQVALARLEGEGLLETRPQSGTFLRRIDLKEYCDHYELRECIEPHAAARAAEKITAAQLKRVRQSCDDYAVLEDYWRTDPVSISDDFLDRAGAAENLFHGTIMEAAGNLAAARIVENLRVLQYNREMTASLPPAIVFDLLKLTVKEHWAVYAALKQRDARAAQRRMLRHLRRGRRYVNNLGTA